MYVETYAWITSDTAMHANAVELLAWITSDTAMVYATQGIRLCVISLVAGLTKQELKSSIRTICLA